MRYTSRPKAARYLRIPTEQFPYGVTCLQIKVFGCSGEVSVLNLTDPAGILRILLQSFTMLLMAAEVMVGLYFRTLPIFRVLGNFNFNAILTNVNF